MTQYGPPQRFKAVDTETGAEAQNVWEIKKRVSGIAQGDWSIQSIPGESFVMSAKNERPPEIKMYQSTGHTINGQELFFGDVVLIDGEMREVQWDHTCSAIVTAKGKRTYPLDWMLPDHILGNVHTPQDALKQRAEELKDG